jgi:CxxC-x17-CxxC domain-containing protein
MEFQDQQITCSDCGGVFTFTAGEQEFYSRKGFSSPPKRCKPCRETRRQRGPSGGGSDGVYRAPGFRDESDRGGGGGGYRPPRSSAGGGGGGGGGPGGGRRPQHEIVCANCGQKATVPFRPAQGKPVYCRDCYSGKKGGDEVGNR